MNIQKQLVGGFNPSENYESQLGWLFPIYGNIKNVPNHQADNVALDSMKSTIYTVDHDVFFPEMYHDD